MMTLTKTIEISDALFERLRKRAQLRGFSSVNHYLYILLDELLKSLEGPVQIKASDEGNVYSDEEKALIEERLRKLGYVE